MKIYQKSHAGLISLWKNCLGEYNMATHELRNRSNWQTISGAKALKTEDVFRKSLQQALDEVHPNMFKIDKHPRDFSSIYSRYDCLIVH